jgi:drug/metabolite transporter (DMT)-like permease
MITSAVPVVCIVISSLIAAFSQLLLKKSAETKYSGRIQAYFNVRVIGSYSLLLFTTFVNMWAMMYMPYKAAQILSTLSFVFVVIFSKIILKENIGHKKIMGMILIISGIIIFNL